MSLKPLEKEHKMKSSSLKQSLREGQMTLKGLSQQATSAGERGIIQVKGCG